MERIDATVVIRRNTRGPAVPSLPQSLAYVVTNIRRAEPPADLFEVPTDYTFVRSSIPDDPLITLTPWRQFAPA